MVASQPRNGAHRRETLEIQDKHEERSLCGSLNTWALAARGKGETPPPRNSEQLKLQVKTWKEQKEMKCESKE